MQPFFKKIYQRIGERKKLLILMAVLLLSLFLAKKLFFVVFFIVLNYLVLWLKTGMGIDSPIEVISLGTFMCGYTYGPLEGMVVALSSLVSIIMTGRINISKLYTNAVLVLIGYVAHYFVFFDISIVGISFLVARYMMEYFVHLVIFNNTEIIGKLPEKIINLIFHAIFYLSYAKILYGIMAIK